MLSVNGDKCYADKPETVDALKDNIRKSIGEIQQSIMCLKNWTDHVGYCMVRRGSHLNEIIFHYLAEGLYLKKRKFGKIFGMFF